MEQSDDCHDDGGRGSPIKVIPPIEERYVPQISSLLAKLIVLIWILQGENGRIGFGQERYLSVIEGSCKLGVEVRGGGPLRPCADADEKNIDQDDHQRAQSSEPSNARIPKRFMIWVKGLIGWFGSVQEFDSERQLYLVVKSLEAFCFDDINCA